MNLNIIVIILRDSIEETPEKDNYTFAKTTLMISNYLRRHQTILPMPFVMPTQGKLWLANNSWLIAAPS